ncbi:unknown protein [Seminavis robusta]|uniref:SnoaL-like domain-containing protein n=1 Tax=Seminavis robusta TaxID=568900 RepID=A0A9N8H6A0_9STRA|nr:unknown protein [Seminavis robusta]|eukprot:Sro140_g065310.1 n/a (242) ;mRNA; f:6086-6811
MKLKQLFKPSKWVVISRHHDAGDDPTVARKEQQGDEHTIFSTSNKSSVSTPSRSSHHREKKSKERKRRKTKPTSSIPQEVEEFKTANEKLVAGLVAVINDHGTAEEMASFFKSGDVRVKLEDVPSITSDVWVVAAEQCIQSFPDFHFQYESIKEDRSGVVLVEELQASGTHTGEPYAFAHFPPIPTSHRHIVNDPERLWLRVKDGKITSMECVSLGGFTGPPGFYVQLGGKTEMPPPPSEE